MVELKTAYSLSQIPFISYGALEEYAEEIMIDFAPKQLTEPAPLDVSDFTQNYLGLKMESHKLCYDVQVLGFTAFQDGIISVLDERTSSKEIVTVNAGTVIIDKSLKSKRNMRRFRFTSAHEGAHWLLHRKAYANDNYFGGNMGGFDIKYLAAKTGRTDYSRSKLEKTDKDRMERQANFLAAAILMPRPALRNAYKRFFNSISEKPRVLVRGADPKDSYIAKQLTNYIADTFKVSNRAALIRLEKLNAIVDKEAQMYVVI